MIRVNRLYYGFVGRTSHQAVELRPKTIQRQCKRKRAGPLLLLRIEQRQIPQRKLHNGQPVPEVDHPALNVVLADQPAEKSERRQALGLFLQHFHQLVEEVWPSLH